MKVDPVTLASGAVVTVLGALLLLDSLDAISFSLGWAAVAFSAGLGVILVVSGLARDAPERHD